MALLNPPNLLPHATRIVVQVSTATTPGYDTERLVTALAPGTIGGDQRLQATNTVRAARTLGLIVEDGDGHLAPSDEAVANAARARGSGWARILRDAAFALHAGDDLFRTGDQPAKSAGARDFLRGITWLLAQDSLGPMITTKSMQQLQRQQFGDVREEWAVVDDEQWQPLLRWGTATGLLSAWPDGLRPIPTDAVRDTLDAMTPGRYPVDQFLDDLGHVLPVLWRGRHRGSLTAALSSDPDPDASRGGMDTSLAVALQALATEGRLRLDPGADAAERIPMYAGAGRNLLISHVEVIA